MGHVDTDDLTLAALGVMDLESLEVGHLRSCPECALHLTRLRETVLAARGADPVPSPLLEPPDRVWRAVTDELGLSAPAETHTVRSWGRRFALVAAAVVIAVASAGVGVLLGNQDRTDPTARPAPTTGDTSGTSGAAPAVLARAELRPLADDLAGSAQWVTSDSGTVLEVEVSGANVVPGYLEVWLLEPGSTRMVSLGALREGVPAAFTVPDGILVSDYPTVDVSAEPLDDDPTHSGVSVARGELRPAG